MVMAIMIMTLTAESDKIRFIRQNKYSSPLEEESKLKSDNKRNKILI